MAAKTPPVDLRAAMLAPRPAADTQRQIKLSFGTVTVRALTRDEIHFVNDKAGDNVRELEAQTLCLAMVDPVLSIADVRKWLEVAPGGEFIDVMTAVSALSGVDEGAQKSGVPAVRGPRARRRS